MHQKRLAARLVCLDPLGLSTSRPPSCMGWSGKNRSVGEDGQKRGDEGKNEMTTGRKDSSATFILHAV